MKTFAANEKRSAPAANRPHPYVHHPVGPAQRAQQAEIGRILRSTGVLAKLSVGRANDPYEQEADRIAEQVMAMPSPGVQRQAVEEQDEETLQTKPLVDQITPLIQRQEDEEEELQPKLQRQEEEEEELQPKLQRQEEEEEQLQPKLQRQEEEEEELQPKLQRQEEEEEEEELQSKLMRKPAVRLQAKGTPDLSDDAAQEIQQTRGQGEPLPEPVRQETEQKIGSDFSGVRVHNNSTANDINRQINARAFTLGNDIYFASGEYAPTTNPGKKLLAHELTHVVQQESAARRKVVQRADDEAPPPESAGTVVDGLVNRPTKTITFSTVQIPAFKGEGHRADLYNGWNLKRSKRYSGSRPSDQQDVWKRGIEIAQIEGMLRQKAEAEHAEPAAGNYLFRSPARPITRGVGRTHRPRGNSHYYIGSLAEIARETSAPSWNRRGSLTTSMEVDHIVEMQISGFPDTPRDQVHAVGNMELLERRPNQISGDIIDSDIDGKVDAVLRNNEKRQILEYSIPGLEAQSHRGRRRDLVRNNYDLVFEGYSARGGSRVSDASYWSKTQIESGEHLRPVVPASFADLGEPGFATVFPKETGGVSKKFVWDGQTTSPSGAEERNWFKPFTMTSKRFWTDPQGQQNLWFGEFGLQIPDDGSTKFKPTRKTVTVDKIPGSTLAGRISKQQVQRSVEGLEVDGASPIRINDVNLEDGRGFVVSGEVIPTIPFLQNANLNFRFENGELYVFRTFSADDLTIPRPFSIDNSSLTVSINTASGLQIDGAVDFGIENIGRGNVSGSVNALGQFGVAGEFDFDERLFGEGTDAQVRVAYEEDQWSMGGTISIPEGKVPGVNSATINVDYSEEEGFAASGDAELDVPGVESGRLEITHNEESGFSMGGEFTLSSDTPGIRSGSISAQVREREDGSGYALSASGTAVPDIPGINSELSVGYNDGAFTAEVTAQYARGMLSGEVQAGVTNRSVNEETGELSETAEENNPLIVYGGGSLTLQIAPWLQGTAGVRFAPNGEITVTGEIGLPDQLEIFARREINRSIFNIAVQAPIIPGIVAEVGGGLSATAGIGPGVIDELRLGIEYNPDREQDTRVTGDAHLNVPADAGLRLSVRAGIGLGITGASATGGLEIGGTLGIMGAAEAGVHVEWSPAQGLDLRANVGIHAQPNFTFDISGYVSVRALGFSVYDERWELASFTYGSDYRFGINLPIHYQEGQPFDISVNDIEFEVPDIDTSRLLRGLISRIA